MGVKYLWTVLTPFCDRKPLYELQGKTVAVDLSCWICEAQNIADYQVQPRMYLRNLYFRACYLLLMDVSPVFVLEGKAPELKYDTITARNAIQFKGARPKTDGVKTGKDRSRFHFVLKQCEDMLGYMGIACIKGNGEAESLCAYLNEDGLVDGCISQDSDCFAYGAQVVYRNFSISTQGSSAASGGAVDVYDIRKANERLNFGRNKIVAMALLIGCDYSEGVHGIGKDSVLKFFETVSNDEVLDKLRSWRDNKKMYENYEKQLADKNICTSCGHSGKVQGHTRNGCNSCKTTKGCDPFKYKEQRLLIKNEVVMRNKAIQDPEFPNETLIKEFLDRKDDVKKLDLTWKQPNIIKFLKFTNKFLEWDELYSFGKILPVLTRWQCRNPELLKNAERLKGVLKPNRIKKVRNPKGVPSYEIIWSDPDGCFEGLIPDRQIRENNVDLEKLWSTIEPQNLVENAYPQLVEAFKQSKIKPKKTGKRQKKKTDGIDKITDNLDNISITEPKPKKTRKPRAVKGQKTIKDALKTIDNEQKTTDAHLDLDSSLQQLTIESTRKTVESDIYDLDSSFKQMSLEKEKKTTKTKVKTLDNFVKKALETSYKQKCDRVGSGSAMYLEECGLKQKFSTPAKPTKTDLSFDLDMSGFDNDSDLELSDIIDNIVSKKSVKNHLQNIALKYVQGIESNGEVICLDDSLEEDDLDDKSIENSPENAPNDLKEGLNDVTSFFTTDPANENDLFEETFNETFRHFSDSSGSDTEEYEYDLKDLNTSDKENDQNKNRNSSGPKSGRIDGHVDVLCVNSDDDSFNDNYVPLYDRIKKK